MSVLKSRREQSEMQFFQTAVDIQNELIKFCMNENNIPKKYRFVYTMPIIAEGQALVNNVVSANTIFVKTNEEVIDRRHYQNEANANCEKILQQLQSLRTVRGADSEQLKIIVGMIVSEKGYITAWKKSDNQRYKEMKKQIESETLEGKAKKLKKVALETITETIDEEWVKNFMKRLIQKAERFIK